MGPEVNTGKNSRNANQSLTESSRISPSCASMTTCTALNVRYETPAKPSRFSPKTPETLQTTRGSNVSASAAQYCVFEPDPRRTNAAPPPARARNKSAHPSWEGVLKNNRKKKAADTKSPYHFRGFSRKPSRAAPAMATAKSMKKPGSSNAAMRYFRASSASSARLSTFPFGVMGSAFRRTKRRGTM